MKQMSPEMAQIVQAFATADFRFEILIAAIIETLLEKKDVAGQPFLTREELDKKAEEIKNKLLEEARKQSNIIIPGQP